MVAVLQRADLTPDGILAHEAAAARERRRQRRLAEQQQGLGPPGPGAGAYAPAPGGPGFAAAGPGGPGFAPAPGGPGFAAAPPGGGQKRKGYGGMDGYRGGSDSEGDEPQGGRGDGAAGGPAQPGLDAYRMRRKQARP